MNTLRNYMDGKWIGDGGDGGIKQDGPTLTVSSATRGTPLNVRYDAAVAVPDGSRDGENWCFEVVLVRIVKGSSVSVGVVNDAEMLPGWKTRGMFYNGNLTNGSAALKTNFGPYLKEGDVVGVLVSNNNRDVTFYHDGRCLGVGFALPEDGKTFCPAIHVSGEVQISFAIPETCPTTVSKEGKKEGLVDEWILTEAVNDSGSLVQIPQGRDIVMNVGASGSAAADANQFDMSLRVGNILRCHLTQQQDGGGVTVGPIMSTMMEPPPELREIETFLSSSLSKVSSMELRENTTLVLRGGDGGDDSKLKLVFARYNKTFEPLNKYTN